MIGKKVIVVNCGEEIKGKIVDVVDEENFLVEVSKTKENIEVSMYDIRSPESA